MELTKTIYVINNFSMGGAETGLLHLLDHDMFQGHDLTIVALFRGTGVLRDALHQRHISTHLLIDKPDMQHTAMPLAYWRLRRFLAQHQPHCMVLSLPQANILGRLAAPKASKVITFEHNTTYAKPIYTPLLRFTARRVDTVFYDSEPTRQAVEGNYKRALPWVYVPLVAVAEDADIPPRDYLLHRPPVLLSAGRLRPEKNHLAVIKAIHQLRDKGITAHYYLAGEGELRAELMEYIMRHQLQEQIHLLGFVDDWGVLRKDADIFIQPSHREGLCISVIEAMADGMPVIATDVGGIRDYGVDNQNIAKTTGNDSNAIAERILTLLQDTDLRQSIGEQARRDVQARFGTPIVQQQIREAALHLTRPGEGSA